MRNLILLLIITTCLCGCAVDPIVPPVSSIPGDTDLSTQSFEMPNGPYSLWGEWTLLIDETHTHAEMVPVRGARLHLNALKFLETQCFDCVEITKIENNGDSTIDLTVRIKHPWPGVPQYTGFDVKGIAMFNGSHVIPNHPYHPFYPTDYLLSWRLMGDPELLNADGFTYRWCPALDPGGNPPMLSYWEGKYANGTPTANINGFLNFFSIEDRHIFEHDASVERTYHIFLPPGPLIAGYAVEACWEPPINTPVTDPVNDFPYSANQPEAYSFEIVWNDNEPIKGTICCNLGASTVYEGRATISTWYTEPPDLFTRWVGCYHELTYMPSTTTAPCDNPPGHPEWRCIGSMHLGDFPNGTYQLMGYEFHKYDLDDFTILNPTYDLIEVIVDID